MSRLREGGTQGPMVFGQCMNGDQNHDRCRGTLRRPDLVRKDGNGQVVEVLETGRFVACACPAHGEADRAAPPPEEKVTRAVPEKKGGRDKRLVDQLSDQLERTGTAELPIPEGADKKEQNCLNSRLHTAARRRGMKVSVTKSRSGKTWIAVVKGGTRKGTGK